MSIKKMHVIQPSTMSSTTYLIRKYEGITGEIAFNELTEALEPTIPDSVSPNYHICLYHPNKSTGKEARIQLILELQLPTSTSWRASQKTQQKVKAKSLEFFKSIKNTPYKKKLKLRSTQYKTVSYTTPTSLYFTFSFIYF